MDLFQYGVILNVMEEIKEHIMKVWKVEVTNDEVWFKNNGMNCRVIFKKAKRGWVNKPIIPSRYVMVDAEMGDMFSFLEMFFSLTSDQISELRLFLMEWATEEHQRYLSNKEDQIDDDPDHQD